MRLPKLPNRIRHHQQDMVQFLGLNLTDNTRDGEFSDMLGLSSSRYPFLSQIKERKTVDDYTAALWVYSYGDDLWVIDGIELKRNGRKICNVNVLIDTKKQIAVINNKLVVFPDKFYVDLETEEKHSLVKKSESYSEYTFTNKSITAEGIGSAFASGDTVDILGGLSGKRLVVDEANGDTITFLAEGLTEPYPGAAIFISSSVPDLNYICSSNNRIWGVSAFDNTIYASALGDPTSFFEYGSDAGSYAVAVGTGDGFTAICSYGGAVLAWKENIVYKVLGSYPSEYYIVDNPIPGVQSGSADSLVPINNVLYYQGSAGISRYAGNSPVLISQALGDIQYASGVAGTDGKRYYIQMKIPGESKAQDVWGLYVYDLATGLWMKEETSQLRTISSFAYHRFEHEKEYRLYFTYMQSLAYMGKTIDPDQEWFGEFVPFVEGTFNRKGYTRLVIRMDMEAGSSMTVKVKQDRGEFKRVWERRATRRMTDVVPLRLGRCDRYTLRIEGRGEVLIRGISREFVTGSEVN